jgi:hypothetical protein
MRRLRKSALGSAPRLTRNRPPLGHFRISARADQAASQQPAARFGRDGPSPDQCGSERVQRLCFHDLDYFQIPGTIRVEVARGFSKYILAVASEFRRADRPCRNDKVAFPEQFPLRTGEDHDRNILQWALIGRSRILDREQRASLNQLIAIWVVSVSVRPSSENDLIPLPGLGQRKTETIACVSVLDGLGRSFCRVCARRLVRLRLCFDHRRLGFRWRGRRRFT